MIERILSIAGKPGLFKLVNQGKNMLIVESLQTGKRTPAYPHDKVISLADIAIYTTDEDMPLYDVFEKVSAKTDCKPVDVKAFKSDAEIRSYFGEILPEFDSDRVYTTDIKKLFSWYNQLLAAGITKFVAEKPDTDKSE
jgi:hypothetical protein